MVFFVRGIAEINKHKRLAERYFAEVKLGHIKFLPFYMDMSSDLKRECLWNLENASDSTVIVLLSTNFAATSLTVHILAVIISGDCLMRSALGFLEVKCLTREQHQQQRGRAG